MKFSKFQASGNDFILLDAEAVESEFLRGSIPALAQSICRRHFGVGADGLILVGKSEIADLKMRIFNPDGSEAEACGNGLRCAAKYAIEQGIYQTPGYSYSSNLTTDGSQPLTVETLTGVRQAKANISENKVKQVGVSMSKPQFQPDQIPIVLTPTLSHGGRRQSEVETKKSPILNYPVMVKGRKLTLSLLSLGNPHAVTFLSRSVAKFPLGRVGPEVEKHPMFPKRTNFEIARVLDKVNIEARVWERGVGETLACGSGACAIAIAAQLLGYVGNSIDIIFPGGTLAISWDGIGEVVLNGPVEEVFSGEWQYNEYE